MQCREFFITGDLTDKYYTVKPFANTLRQLILSISNNRKIYFTNQNAIKIKKIDKLQS